MSGHSKWSQIKRKKAVTDAKKAQIFSKFSKIIEIAARKGIDPKSNFSLKTAVEQARSVNMPAVNIEKAIKKGGGKEGGSFLEEVLYEAYGPGGVAILILGVTSSKNRTVSELKHIFFLHHSSLAGVGSVKWLFEQKFENGEITWSPKQIIELGEENNKKLELLLEALEDNEDVTDVFTNSE